MDFCGKCGQKLTDEVIFCPSCGAEKMDIESDNINTNPSEVTINPKEKSRFHRIKNSVKKYRKSVLLVFLFITIAFVAYKVYPMLKGSDHKVMFDWGLTRDEVKSKLHAQSIVFTDEEKSIECTLSRSIDFPLAQTTQKSKKIIRFDFPSPSDSLGGIRIIIDYYRINDYYDNLMQILRYYGKPIGEEASIYPITNVWVYPNFIIRTEHYKLYFRSVIEINPGKGS